ncbi:M23 family metallopeptidase [Candidatus Pelagibacter sp. HIMB1321]|uniref:M23 family metallopeptidase n=1 Tax=Candidatus Pelagibacter sp. HIMB1321 TaxID=1388755 RepID=UPI000A07E7F2|nr:M23 family metallopeptidase [Candidatus Pelagibacter sp. HIMB1321]SMF73960.1 Murein DD-endopeptidase MepM and murein hydrolase activator NlpD, contain LysM domain [Candidatus Pelagibacter sp. HIMB1321]
MDSSIIYKSLFFFLIIISQAKSIEFTGKFFQGHFIVGKTDPNAKIIIDKKNVKVSDEGYFVFGIDRDRKFDLKITKVLDNKKDIFIKKIFKRKYNIQRIDGLPENKVTPPESVYKRIKEENNKIGEARAINSDLIFFKDKFIMPVDGIISGVYGSQRILNGKPKWPHYGIDIAAKKGTPIKSSGGGVITMAEKDLYYTGGTIIMDHGHGISTIYSHLENILVSVGDQINQGDIIGTVGSTGRSTGPHLDFRVNWFQTRLDPMTVIN